LISDYDGDVVFRDSLNRAQAKGESGFSLEEF
jgi:hypothetical protein